MYGGKREVYTGLSWGNLRERNRLEDRGDNINMDLQEVGCGGYGLDRSGSG